MRRLNVEVRKTAKGEPLAGEFFIKPLDFDGIQDYYRKMEKATPEEQRMRLVQMCFVNKDGSPVFKPQQLNIIKDRLIGSHLTVVLLAVDKYNDFGVIEDFLKEDGEYAKNSESDQG